MTAALVFLFIVALIAGLIASIVANGTRRQRIILIDDVPPQQGTSCGTALVLIFIVIVILALLNV